MTHQYGWCNGQAARLNIQTGEVQIFNRAVGYRGPMESCWRRVADKHRSAFEPW